MEPQAQSPTPPVMDVTPPQSSQEPVHENHDDPAPAPKKGQDKHPAEPKVKKPKNGSKGVGLAIVATVIIVLALAALATYAYLKQNHQL